MAVAVAVVCAIVGATTGRWPVVALAGIGAALSASALVPALISRLLRPVRSLQASIEQITRGGVEPLAAHCGPPELRRLVERVNELAALAQGQRLFLADVSHQLRTELHLLTVRLERLSEHVSDQGTDTHALAVADAERLRSTLTEHLELARLIDGSPPIKVEAGAVAEERVRAWSEVAARRGLRMNLRTEASPVILTRRGVLEQVLDVLVDNAIKHSPRSGAITVGVCADEHRATIRVLDQGPGMTPEQRRRATERGWRAEQRTGTGSGLGLSIAAMLVSSNGGRLRLDEGCDGRGLDACCTFPLLD